MEQKWLQKNNAPNCILFFNGWGMDEHAVRHLDCGDFDVLMLYDYSSLGFEFDDLSVYETVHVVAWSLGVWATTKVVGTLRSKITKSIAINGTPRPVDDKLGIPPAVFKATYENWDDRNREKFNMRMCGGRSLYQQVKPHMSQRSIENQKTELGFILDELGKSDDVESSFDVALIGSNDLIFKPENQRNYWDGRTEIVEKEMPHYPFRGFISWAEIID